jgi:hypothetical protein
VDRTRTGEQTRSRGSKEKKKVLRRVQEKEGKGTRDGSACKIQMSLAQTEEVECVRWIFEGVDMIS